MKLFESTKLGHLTLKNSMVMSAMTRSRADINGVVGDLTVQYYSQRVSAGVIITEAINISQQAIGSPFTPGIFTKEQIGAWKKVTKAVHDHGGIIFAQLWHTGRAGHSVDRQGLLPVAPSAIPVTGMQHFTSQGLKDYETPRALSVEEIRQIIKDYGQAARNAMEAGFDGVELHAANGYLPNQFLAESANKRTDGYGGTIPNKARFVLEVIRELIGAVGGDKVGIKISPFHPYEDIILDNPVATYTYLMEELNKLDISFVEIMKRNPAFPAVPHYPMADEIELFGSLSTHTVIANMGYDKATGEAELQKGIARLISYGTLFLANPDLPLRFEKNAPLNQPDRASMFGGGEHGYTDYPSLKDNVQHIKSSDGNHLSIVGDTYRIVISGKDTGGEFAMIDMQVPQGHGPGPHAHASFQETFYVMDGEVEFRTKEAKILAQKGDVITIPKGGAVHSFKNVGNSMAHLLCTVVPAGLDAFFEEIGTPVKAGEFLPPPRLDENVIKKLMAAARKYGQEVYPPDFLDK